MEDKLLSISEVANYLKIPKSTIYKLSQRKGLPSCKIGKQLRFRKSSVDNWLADQETPQDVEIKNKSAKQSAFKKILLIDDDELVQRTIRKFLEREGYHVELAKNGEEAIKKVTQIRFDLMIVDVRMPGINGIETIKRIRSLNRKSKIPTIPEVAITGYMDTQAAREAEKLGITDYVYKPFSISDFMKTINKKIK